MQPENLVGGDGAGEALELELARRRRFDGVLDRCEEALADQDLPRLACVLSREARFATGPTAP